MSAEYLANCHALREIGCSGAVPMAHNHSDLLSFQACLFQGQANGPGDAITIHSHRQKSLGFRCTSLAKNLSMDGS